MINAKSVAAMILRLAIAALPIAICCNAVSVNVASLQDGEQTRKLWDSDYFKPKPKSPVGKQTAGKPVAPRPHYRIATPNRPPARVNGDTVVGITLWRLRTAKATDGKEVRRLKHIKDNAVVGEWTPERISMDTPLMIGQRVRLSIESARTGYLYVIDRELYADGTLGEPSLIFPTTKLRGGNNRVIVRRIIDIPMQEDDPPYFTLDPEDRTDLAGEVISVLITPQPLPNVKIGEDPAPLSKEEVAAWEKKWGAQVGRLEMDNPTTKTWTKEENDASTPDGQPLKADSPAPQTIFYRPDVKPTDPLLVNLRLRYGKARPPAR